MAASFSASIQSAPLAQRAPVQPGERQGRSGRRPGSAPPIARPPDTGSSTGPTNTSPTSGRRPGRTGFQPHRITRFQSENAASLSAGEGGLVPDCCGRWRIPATVAEPARHRACSAICGLRRASLLVARGRDAVAPGEGPRQVAWWSGQPPARPGRAVRGQAALGLEQAQRHQHLLRRGVAMRLKLRRKWKGSGRPARQLFQRQPARQMRAHVVDDGAARPRRGPGAARGRGGGTGQQRVQGAVEGQRLTRAPQGVEQGGDARRWPCPGPRQCRTTSRPRPSRARPRRRRCTPCGSASRPRSRRGVQFIGIHQHHRTAPGDRRHGRSAPRRIRWRPARRRRGVRRRGG